MMTKFFAIIVVLICWIAFKRNYSAPAGDERFNFIWYGLGLLALLFAGLLISGQLGNETAAYGFGIAFILVTPLIIIVGIAGAIGRALRKRKKVA